MLSAQKLSGQLAWHVRLGRGNTKESAPTRWKVRTASGTLACEPWPWVCLCSHQTLSTTPIYLYIDSFKDGYE